MIAQFEKAEDYKNFIDDAADEYGFQPSIIGGIGSRESHWGLVLKPKGPTGQVIS